MTPTTLFGLMAALAVFVLVIVLLQDRREMVTVAMTSERVPAGATITEGMVERAEVPASVRFSGDLVPFDEAVRSTASRTLQPGEPVPRSAVGARNESSGAGDGDPGGVVAGGRRQLDVGDRVDVIDTGDEAHGTCCRVPPWWDVRRLIATAASSVRSPRVICGSRSR